MLLCVGVAGASFNPNTFATSTGVSSIGNGWTMDTSSGNLVFKKDTVTMGTIDSSGNYTPATALNVSTINLTPLASAPTAVTTGVQLYATKDATPKLEVLGASGISPGIRVPKLAIGPAGSALPTYAGCVKQYFNWSDGTVLAWDQSGASGTIGTGDCWQYASATYNWNAASGTYQLPSVYSDVIRNRAGTGAPSFDRGIAIPAGYGTTYTAGAKPADPGSGKLTVHAGLAAGVAVLSVEKAGATTHIVTITP